MVNHIDEFYHIHDFKLLKVWFRGLTGRQKKGLVSKFQRLIL